MTEFQNGLEQLQVSGYQAAPMTSWNQQGQYGQYPTAVYGTEQVPVDPSRLCVGFGRCSGFCAGFCAGFCGVFCSGFCGGFCGGFCSNCGGFCHNCGGFGHRCR